MVGVVRKLTGPPLRRVERERVEYEFVLLRVEGRGSLERCHVGTMADLSLCIAPNNIEVV